MDPRKASLLTKVNELPRNNDAERLVLGAVMLTDGLWPSVREYLRPTDFFLPTHQLIARAFDRLLARRVTQPDPVLLCEELSDQLASCGGPAYLASLIDGTPALSNLQNYCEIVLQKSIERQVMYLGRDMISDPADADLSDAGMTPYQRIEQMMQRLQTLRDRRPGTRWEPVSNLIQLALDALNGPPRSVSTGFPALDRLLLGGGWLPGRVYIIAARTNVGKSSFGMGSFSAMHQADPEAVTGYISLEQTRQSFSLRLLGINAEIPYNELQTMRTSMFSPATYQRVQEFRQECAGWNYEYQYNPRIQPGEIKHECAALKRRHNNRLNAVFIDYPALIQDDGAKPYESRTRQLRAISAKLKEIAGELDVPVIVPVQINRQGAAATRGDERLALDHLGESDAWAQDPDTVILINRKPAVFGGAEYPMLVDVAKQRDGITGETMLGFDRSCGRYINAEGRYRDTTGDDDLNTVMSMGDVRQRYLGGGAGQ